MDHDPFPFRPFDTEDEKNRFFRSILDNAPVATQTIVLGEDHNVSLWGAVMDEADVKSRDEQWDTTRPLLKRYETLIADIWNHPTSDSIQQLQLIELYGMITGVVNTLKKSESDKHAQLKQDFGNVFHFLTYLILASGLTIEDVIVANAAKLIDRKSGLRRMR